MNEETKERLVLIFGTGVFSLGHERLLTLNAACTDGYITNESLRVVLNQHKAEVADLLKDMCKHKLLVQEGYGRGTKYRLPMTVKVASSGSKVASSGSKVASSPMPNLIKQRMSYSELKDKICSFCSDWVSVDELAEELRRKRTYLRNKIIPKMLEDNSLEMLFLGVPNHPRQKYKSTVKK